MHHLDLTHEAYVFLAVKVRSEMDQFGKVNHFVMQLNIPGKNSFDERFSIFSYVTQQVQLHLKPFLRFV